MHKDVWNGWRISCQSKNLKHPTALTSSLLYTQQKMLIYSLLFSMELFTVMIKWGEEKHKMWSVSESLHIFSLLRTSPTSTLGVYVYMRKSQFFYVEIYCILYQSKFAPESSKYVSFSPTHFFSISVEQLCNNIILCIWYSCIL